MILLRTTDPSELDTQIELLIPQSSEDGLFHTNPKRKRGGGSIPRLRFGLVSAWGTPHSETTLCCRYINGHETCTDSISHTRAIIFFPFVTINATIGSIVASTKTQSSDA